MVSSVAFFFRGRDKLNRRFQLLVGFMKAQARDSPPPSPSKCGCRVDCAYRIHLRRLTEYGIHGSKKGGV